jgi:hypothetical protein
VSGRKSYVADWRDALRESELDKWSKLVGFCLSTFFNANGQGFPSRATLAAGGSVSEGTVHGAIRRLERAGFLKVHRTRGRESNTYTALLPNPSHADRFDGGQPVTATAPTRHAEGSNPSRRDNESAESAESGALHADAAFEGVAASARGVCVGCGEEKRLAVDQRCAACYVWEAA